MEGVKVQLVGLARNAAHDDDGAPTVRAHVDVRPVAHGQGKVAHVRGGHLRRRRLGPVCEAETLCASHGEQVGRERAGHPKRRLLVHVGGRHGYQLAHVVQRARHHGVPPLVQFGSGGEVGRVLGEHLDLHRALAQVGPLALKDQVRLAGDARVALLVGGLLARVRAVDADLADAAAPLRGLEAGLTDCRGSVHWVRERFRSRRTQDASLRVTINCQRLGTVIKETRSLASPPRKPIACHERAPTACTNLRPAVGCSPCERARVGTCAHAARSRTHRHEQQPDA